MYKCSCYDGAKVLGQIVYVDFKPRVNIRIFMSALVFVDLQ